MAMRRFHWAGAALLLVLLTGSAPAARGVREADIDSATGRNILYVTEDAMFLANQQWLLYSCELPAGQTDVGSSFNKDSYWYSRYNLGNLLFRSGMGIHIVHNPLFLHHSQTDRKADGTKMFPRPVDFMHFKIRQFCARTGLPCRLDPQNRDNPKAFPPQGVFPIFLEFSSGSPRFTQPPVLNDFSTLRWDPASIDRTILAGALGQTLMKEVLWSEDFFAYHRKGPNGETLFGNDKEYGNGFRGAVLTAMSITKMFTLKSSLAYEPKSGILGGVDPKTYDPKKGLRYFPHAIRAEFKTMPGMPPKPVAWKVTDPTSRLFDQASLLWGTSEFYFYSDPKVKDSFDVLFGDQGDHRSTGALFPLKPHVLSMGLAAVVFKNMMAMHFDKEHGSFDSEATPGHRSGRIRTADAGMTLVALANVLRRLRDAPHMLLGMVQKAVTAQGNFLKNKLQAADGGFANSYSFTSGPSRDTRTLTSQGLGIQGLLAAYSVTGDPALLEAAHKAYDFANRTFWSQGAKSYRSEEGVRVSTYTPRNVGAMLGALRELAVLAKGSERTEITGRIDGFFAAAETRHRQQLAEIDPTGEPIPPMAQLKRIKAKLMQLMKTDPQRAKMMKMKMADVDGDGVPKPGMAGGAFGFAPVPAAEVKVATP